MKKKRTTLLLFAFVALTVPALSQMTYDIPSLHGGWSVYAYGGVNVHHGMRGDAYVGDVHVGPTTAMGINYSIGSSIRFGFDGGYSCLFRSNDETPAFTHFTYTQPWETKRYNTSHLMTMQLGFEVNVLRLWPYTFRRVGLWLGTGVGFLYGWNRTVVETNTMVGADEVFVRTDQLAESDAIYFPLSASLEWSVTPRFALTAGAQYLPMPIDVEHTPHGIANMVLGMRYRFGRGGSRRQEEMETLIQARTDAEVKAVSCHEASLRVVDSMQAVCRQQNSRLQQENDSLVDLIIDLRDERSRRIREIEALKKGMAVPTLSTDDNAFVEQDVDDADESPAPTTAMSRRADWENMADTSVYFDVSSSEINEAGAIVLASVAAEMKRHPEKKISFIGYSSTTGAADYNRRLAEDRLYSVRRTLLRLGVSPSQFGDQQVGPSVDSSAHSRRVTMIIR